MIKCTDKPERWPHALTDVSADEMGAFLAHAENCPFHAEKLRAEDEEVLSLIRRARGLDSQGRVLQGKELKETIAKHERGHILWQEAARRMKSPFKRIYLSNRGEDIASSGKFYDFRRYEGYHPLDLQAGLQIWGVLETEGVIEEVLLGFYSLVGVPHTGKEELLPLVNGYTVGLKVEQLTDRLFKVEFRCVENKVLEAERIEAVKRKKKGKHGPAFNIPNTEESFSARIQRAFTFCSSLLLPSRLRLRYKSAERVVTASLCVVMTFGFPFTPKKGDSLESIVPTASLNYGDRQFADGGHWLSADTKNAATHDKTDKMGMGHRKKQSIYKENQLAVKDSRTEVKLNSLDPTLSLRPSSPSKNEVMATENGQSTVLSSNDLGDQTEKLDLSHESAWSFMSFASHRATSDKRTILHTGHDRILREKVFAEINQRAISIVPLNNRVVGVSSPEQLTATWDIIREETSVTVEINLTSNGESRLLSFRSDKPCLEQACNEAVRDAVSGVFAVINQNMEATKQS